MTISSDVDVAIIGAGAAGLGAAHTLSGQGLSILVIEARDRIGGRAFTKRLPGGIAFDVGCEWLHSADLNAFVPIARSLNFEIVESPPHWEEQTYSIHFPVTQQHEFQAESNAFSRRLQLASHRPEDTEAAAWLKPGNKWNPLIDAMSSYVNGAELCHVSVHDTESYVDTNLNWRVRSGFGCLIAAYGSKCSVALRTEVISIDHSGQQIELATSRGMLRARRVIYTLPSSLTAEEAIRFSPKLVDKVTAAAGLPLGRAEKVMLGIENPEDFPEDGHLFGAIDRVDTGSYDLRPMGQPCIEAFFGGTLARDLEAAGELEQFAIDELVALLGSSFRKRIKGLASSSWGRDRYAGGSYSHALPHHAHDRVSLGIPVDDRIFFAGEATSPEFFSTAHGAYETGVRAARELAQAAGIVLPTGATDRSVQEEFERDHMLKIPG